MTSFSIFVVDDEEVARNGITLALEDDYRARGFESAEDALAAVAQEQPDIMLLDIGLPGMSGTEALQQIKERYPDIVVIMITAFEDIATVVAAMKGGAYDYIVKPVHMDSLLVTIQNACESTGDIHESPSTSAGWCQTGTSPRAGARSPS